LMLPMSGPGSGWFIAHDDGDGPHGAAAPTARPLHS
jgi:hypothetical protein